VARYSFPCKLVIILLISSISSEKETTIGEHCKNSKKNVSIPCCTPSEKYFHQLSNHVIISAIALIRTKIYSKEYNVQKYGVLTRLRRVNTPIVWFYKFGFSVHMRLESLVFCFMELN